MISVSLLVSSRRPEAEQDGLIDLGPAVVREVRESYPAQRKLYAVFFVSRTEPFRDLDMRTSIMNPDGSVLDASRKAIPLRGTWDFVTGSVDLGEVYLPEPGPYVVNLYVKNRSDNDWPDEPDCFWLMYATTPAEDAYPAGEARKSRRNADGEAVE